jgi:hypothetical protein
MSLRGRHNSTSMLVGMASFLVVRLGPTLTIGGNDVPIVALQRLGRAVQDTVTR